MKGSFVMMTRLSTGQQIAVLTEMFKPEIALLDSLPEEEAKKKARKELIEAGIVDNNGQYTEPYSALRG